ncbi:MAG: type 4a pilus biogenesis protein PilO [Candidatus Gottesmanbacteria bacterium]
MNESTFLSPRLNRYYTKIQPLVENPQVQAYSMLILSFFAIAFFGFFAIKPTVVTIAQLQRQISDSKLVEQKLQEKINALSQAQVAYEAVKPDLGVIMSALPSNAQFPTLIKGFEKISAESGTTLVNLNFQSINLTDVSKEATGAATETPVTFSLTAAGDYNQLSDFIRKLSFLDRLATIESLNITMQKKEENINGVIRLNLKGEAYYVQ